MWALQNLFEIIGLIAAIALVVYVGTPKEWM